MIQQLFASETLVHNLPNFNSLSTPEGVRVLVILDRFVDENADKEQIMKIFQACKVTPEQLYITDERVAWQNISGVESIKEVFLFNVDPKSIHIHYTLFPYKMLGIGDKQIMLADELRMIMGNAQLKADFWNKALKPYYIGK